MTMRQETLVASSLDTAETVPVNPVPVSLVRAYPTSDTETGDSRASLNDTMPEGDDIESSIFIKLQPYILKCASDLTQNAVMWELQGRDPVQDAFYYQSSEIVADAKSLGAEVVRESHLLGQGEAPLQMSCSLIPYAMSHGNKPSDLSKKRDMTAGHSTRESSTCDATSTLPECEAFSPKTRQNIVNMSVNNMITDSLEKSIKDVIETTILKKTLLNGTTKKSIPSALQTGTDSSPDELLIRTDFTAYDVNSASCNNTTANLLKDTSADINTPLAQVVEQTDQQSMSDKQTLSTSASQEVLPLWQTQEIVTMSVEDMTESTETKAECVQSVSTESSKSPDGEISMQTSQECDQTTQFMVTQPLGNLLRWQTPEIMECISKEVQEVLPVSAAFHPMSPLPTPETCVPDKNVIYCTNQAAILPPHLTPPLPTPDKNVIYCTNQAAILPPHLTPPLPTPDKNVISFTNPAVIKEVLSITRRDDKLPSVVLKEIPQTRFSQEPIWTSPISQSHQTLSETFNSSEASYPLCPYKRKLLDQNNNFNEPPQKQFYLNSRVATSTSHPVLFQELTVPLQLQGQPQGGEPPVLPPLVQQGDTLPALRSKLQPSDGFSNTVHTTPNRYTTIANAPWINIPNPNINFPGVPISNCQPLNANCRLSGLQSDCVQVENSAYTLPKHPSWTQGGPIMSTHHQISGESSAFPGLAKRPAASQQALPQVMTNTQCLISTGSLRFPYNFSRMATNGQPQERPALSQLPPPSYFSSLRPPIEEMQHGASLASNSSCNFHQDKFRASSFVDRNQILQCIRRPPPPYRTRQVHPNSQDQHTFKHLPRRASADLDYWRAYNLLQRSPQTASIPAPNRETSVETRQAILPENYENTSCLNCAVTIPTDDKYRVLKRDVVAVLKNAIDLSLPPTAEKPSIVLCKCCEEVMHTVCKSRQALTLAKEKFIDSTSPEGYLKKKKTYSTIVQVLCVNCGMVIIGKSKRRRLFSPKKDKWVAANVIQEEFNISLEPEKAHGKLYLCSGCYRKVNHIRSAQVSISTAMNDFNLRMSPSSHMFMFNQRFLTQ